MNLIGWIQRSEKRRRILKHLVDFKQRLDQTIDQLTKPSHCPCCGEIVTGWTKAESRGKPRDYQDSYNWEAASCACGSDLERCRFEDEWRVNLMTRVR